MQGPALRATGRNNMNKMLAAAGGLTAKRATARKMETLLSEAQWYVRFGSTTAAGRVQWPERWKHNLLKRNGMFDFAERQQLEECSGQKDGNATF